MLPNSPYLSAPRLTLADARDLFQRLAVEAWRERRFEACAAHSKQVRRLDKEIATRDLRAAFKARSNSASR